MKYEIDPKKLAALVKVIEAVTQDTGQLFVGNKTGGQLWKENSRRVDFDSGDLLTRMESASWDEFFK